MRRQIQKQLRNERIIRYFLEELYGVYTFILLWVTAILLYCDLKAMAFGAFAIFAVNMAVIWKYDL